MEPTVKSPLNPTTFESNTVYSKMLVKMVKAHS